MKQIENKKKQCKHKNNVLAGYLPKEGEFRVCSLYARHCCDCGINYSCLTGDIINDDDLIPVRRA